MITRSDATRIGNITYLQISGENAYRVTSLESLGANWVPSTIKSAMLETSFQESFPPFPWSTPGAPQEWGFNAGQTQLKLGRLSCISQTSTPQFPRLVPSRYLSVFGGERRLGIKLRRARGLMGREGRKIAQSLFFLLPDWVRVWQFPAITFTRLAELFIKSDLKT